MYAGALHPAIRASVAVPGFLEPVEFEHMQLVDGGLLNPVPVNLARKLGADVVIGVDLNAHVEPEPAESMTGVFHRTIEVMTNRIRLYNREIHPADYWLEPRLDDYSFFDFHRTEDAIQLGRKLAAKHAKEIRELKKPHVLTGHGAVRVPEMLGRALNYVSLREETQETQETQNAADKKPKPRGRTSETRYSPRKDS